MEMNSIEQMLGSGETELALCSRDTSRGVNYSLSYVCRSGYSFHKAAGGGSVRTVQQEMLNEQEWFGRQPSAECTATQVLVSCSCVLVLVVQDVHVENKERGKRNFSRTGQSSALDSC
jgi:hypothetical protein